MNTDITHHRIIIMVDAVKLLRKMQIRQESTEIESPQIGEDGGGSLDAKLTPKSRDGERLSEREFVFNINKDLIKIKILEDSIGTWASGNGATVWDSSVVMSDHIISNFLDRRDITVLELGSGVGLISILLAKMGIKVIASERQLAMDLLVRNVRHNGFLLTADSTNSTADLLTIKCIDWLHHDIKSTIESLGHIDVVLGSDLIFPANSDCWPALADVISFVLSTSPGSKVPRIEKNSYLFTLI